MKLSPKQHKFVAEYLIDLNGTQAAVRAGYSPKSAEMQASRLLRNVKVQEHLSDRMKAREIRTGITQDRVLKELAAIGFADIRKAVQWTTGETVREGDGRPMLASAVLLVPSIEIDDETAAAISEVAQTKEGVKIKFHDKRAALVDIGKHLGMFKERLEVTGKDGTPLIPPKSLSELYRELNDTKPAGSS